MVKSVARVLGSLRLTVGLILLLGLTFLVGLWVPQKGVVQKEMYLQWQARSPGLVSLMDALRLTEIYSSPVTLALWGMFFLNLALVMGKRIPLVLAKVSLDDGKIVDPESAPGYTYLGRFDLPDGFSADRLKSAFQREGYRIHGTRDHFYAVRNRLAPVASLLFHLSFFLMLLGGTISVYSKFTGYLDLAVGESFSGEIERFNPTPRMPKIGSPPAATLTVSRITPRVEGEMATGLEVEIRDDRGGVHKADVNRPYKVGKTSFVVNDLGVAPLVVLRDAGGRELDGAYAKLDVLKGKEDGFALGGYRFRARFFPDYEVVGGVAGTRSEEFNNPAFEVTIEKGGVPIGRRTLFPGRSVDFDGHRLELREMPFWVRFFVVKEYGVGILYAGFAVATMALIWRLIFYRREMVGKVRTEGGREVLHLAGRAEFYRALSEDEFRDTVASILDTQANAVKEKIESGKGVDG